MYIGAGLALANNGKGAPQINNAQMASEHAATQAKQVEVKPQSRRTYETKARGHQRRAGLRYSGSIYVRSFSDLTTVLTTTQANTGEHR